MVDIYMTRNPKNAKIWRYVVVNVCNVVLALI